MNSFGTIESIIQYLIDSISFSLQKSQPKFSAKINSKASFSDFKLERTEFVKKLGAHFNL